MRIAIAGFELESVTFLPEQTDIPDFEFGARRGDDVIEGLRGTNTVIGGFIKVCDAERVEVEGIVAVGAGAAAAASDAAWEKYTTEIVDGLRALKGKVDGLLIFLHGALAAPTRLKADASVLEAIRAEVGPDFPIGAGMDLHGNLGPEVIGGATVVCGYRHSPHTDMGQTGERTASILIRSMRGEIRPTMAIAKPGIMLPSIFTATSLRPLADLIAEAREWEKQDGVLDVSLFCGFAYADVPDCGMSVVAVTDGDPMLAREIAHELSARAESLRHQLFKRELVHDVAGGLDRAMALAEQPSPDGGRKPVVLLEHADRMNDSTYTLREMLARGIKRAMVPYMWDPAAAEACIAAGEGSTVTLSLGGKSSPKAGDPLEVTGKVVYAGHKTYRITGPLRTGMLNDLGPTALIDLGGILVSIISVQYSAIDRDPFDQFGLRIEDFDYVLLRSKTHFRHVWEPLSREIVIVDTPDWGPADLPSLPYRHIPPGVFPVTRSD